MSVQIYINNTLFEVKSNISILQACEVANIILPRFCYHERLSVAGNCRMCLVEIDKMPKLQVSCAVSVSPFIHIKTNSPAVKKAREGVLEFLLVNHPLDCPICDQGGECDLQDQSLIYGGDKGRFKEFKRAVEDKNLGPLIKTIMTRCIHCTRCIRFINEITGIPNFGTSGRGNFLEIGSYINRFFNSELSGNLIDLCPVGALTSKPNAFLSRPWELRSVESIDLFDSIHSNIRIDTRGYEIMRVLPRLNESLNEEWISDKIRFGFDGFFLQRLVTPLKKSSTGSFDKISWVDALNIILDKLLLLKNLGNKSCFCLGDSCDLQSLSLIKTFSSITNGFIIRSSYEIFLNVDYQYVYKFNTFLKNIIKSDFCLLLGIDPKIEGILLFYHLRKRFLLGNFKLVYLGSKLKLNFPCVHLGNSLKNILSIVEGNSFICKILKNSVTPNIIIGKSFLHNFKFFNVNIFFHLFKNNISFILNGWNIFSFFNLRPSDFSMYDLNLNYNSYLADYKFDFLYILENYNDISRKISFDFCVFQGHHGCLNAQNADIIIPSSSFVEKRSIFVNCEGRYQYSYSAVPALGDSKDSFTILIWLLNNLYLDWYLKLDCNFKNLQELHEPFINLRSMSSFYGFTIKDFNLKQKSSNFEFEQKYFDYHINYLLPSFSFLINRSYDVFFKNFVILNSQFVIENNFFESSLFDNFYNTCKVTEVSYNMLKCSKYLLDKSSFIF